MKLLKQPLRYITLLSILFLLFGGKSFAQTYYDWIGTKSSDWTNAQNWQSVPGGVTTSQATDYPGHVGITDGATVYVGVHVAVIGAVNKPQINTGSTINIGSLDLGDNLNTPSTTVYTNNRPLTLIVNGTVNITGAFTQEHSTAGYAGSGNTSPYYYHQTQNYVYSTSATGGTITCGSFNIGDSK